MQTHDLFIHTYHWFLGTQRFLIDGQHIFHALDVLLIQLRHAPHFFPATAPRPCCLLLKASSMNFAERMPAIIYSPCLCSAKYLLRFRLSLGLRTSKT